MPRGRRGRGRCRRWIGSLPPVNRFHPWGESPGGPAVSIRVEEVEALRLVDLVGLDQEAAAVEMGISRRTLWNDLQSARKKVALALVEGKAIIIEGGSYSFRGEEKEEE